MATRILTWNLQGRARPDLDAVADVIGTSQPDLVLLQEVQRRDAAALGRRLRWSSVWRFKHWPVVAAAEGLAVLSPSPPAATRTQPLAHPLRFWSWRRRIAVTVDVTTPDGPMTVVDTHLGADVSDDERVRQARTSVRGLAVSGPAGTGPEVPTLVAGDLNALPGSPVLDAFGALGLRDAWTEVRGDADGPTNWTPGPRTDAPTQRLDYVLVSERLRVVDAVVPSFGHDGFERYGDLSDHLPLVVVVESV